MSQQLNLKPQKYSWIDIARTIGAFFIILIHVSDTYTINIPVHSSNWMDISNWVASVFWNVIPRCGVPLFIAISGYVLLSKQDNVNKRIVNLLKPLIFWSLFYALLALTLNAKSNPDFVKQLLIKGFLGIWAFAPHLWFLYMLLGLYPTFRTLNSHREKLRR